MVSAVHLKLRLGLDVGWEVATLTSVRVCLEDFSTRFARLDQTREESPDNYSGFRIDWRNPQVRCFIWTPSKKPLWGASVIDSEAVYLHHPS